MIDRQNGKLVWECDTCLETFEPDTGDFNEASAAAKRDGWKAAKVGDVWVHACPDCQES
jgi:ribosomal protein L37AE/L43A